jgi:hypothetical protein
MGKGFGEVIGWFPLSLGGRREGGKRYWGAAMVLWTVFFAAWSVDDVVVLVLTTTLAVIVTVPRTQARNAKRISGPWAVLRGRGAMWKLGIRGGRRGGCWM